MPINKEALKSFKLFFGNKYKIPQKVIYPTIHIPEESRKHVKKKKQIIFISTTNILEDKIFLIKGGLETLEAFKSLSKKYPEYSFIILGKIPKYLDKNVPKNLILKCAVSRQEMWKLFNESQIFVQPSYHAPTMAFLEAMFFRLPIVTSSFWGNKEYVDKTNGIAINLKKVDHIDNYNIPNYSPEVLKKIRQNAKFNAKKIEGVIEKLINNKKLREKLGKGGLKKVLTGKFSIKEKNKNLKKIYQQALLN